MKRFPIIASVFLPCLLVIASCEKQVTEVAVNEACKQNEDRAVRVEGYFRLLQSSEPPVPAEIDPQSYMLLLVEKENGTGSFLNVQVPFTASKERNRLDALPQSYTYSDLHINTDSGLQASAVDRVAVTGQVTKDSRSCVLQVDKIETAQLPNK